MKGVQQAWKEAEWLVKILFLYWAWLAGFLGQLLCAYTHVLWAVRYFPLWSRYEGLNLLDWGNKIPALRKCLVVCCLSTTFSSLKFCEHCSFTRKKNFCFWLAPPPCPSLPGFFPPPEHSSFLLLSPHWRQQKTYILDYTWHNYIHISHICLKIIMVYVCC